MPSPESAKNTRPNSSTSKLSTNCFREQIDARQLEDQRLRDTHLYDKKIWKKLFEFQRDGAKDIINRLNRYNGCILADSVGLGKTYTALAVIKYFELNNDRVLVLSPKKLEDNWSLYPAYNSHKANPVHQGSIQLQPQGTYRPVA